MGLANGEGKNIAGEGRYNAEEGRYVIREGMYMAGEERLWLEKEGMGLGL